MVIKYTNQITKIHLAIQPGNFKQKIISCGKSMESGDKTAFCMLAIFRTDGKDS